jgi:glycerol-3-phosphate dehydrogenase subunit C
LTTTYDPTHPAYLDEEDLRDELRRVYDICHGCRLCLHLCPAFPMLFNLIDARDGEVADLSPLEQDHVVEECYGCKLCYVKCPYVPPHEWQLDFPRLMLRAQTVAKRTRRTLKQRLSDQAFGRTDLTGKAATIAPAVADLANAALGQPGSFARRMMDSVVGIASERLLPPYARSRFSTWFRRRGRPAPRRPSQGRVAIFPTCLVEYQNPAIGMDLVRVYERNGVDCQLPQGIVCCGAPWLHGGDFAPFRKQAARNVAALVPVVKGGSDVVVPQPTCGYVLKRDYPEYLGTDDARLVAEHTFDAAEYLWRLHKGDGTTLDTEFAGEVPASVAYHVPCHLQAQNIGLRSRDLLKLTGTKVSVVQKCSGIDGSWGLRSKNYQLARQVAEPLKEAIESSSAEVVAGDCQLANTAIEQETGRKPLHPLQVLARAYGIEPGQ